MPSSAHLHLTILSIVCLTACSGGPKASPAQLKAAALRCDIAAFREHMPPASAATVVKASEEMASVQKAMDELFAAAQRRFGNKVSRQPDAVRFEIDAQDPRWDAIFGPQWKTLKSAPPPHYFTINGRFAWQEECKVVQQFASCLSEPSQCSENEVPGSALQMSRAGGHLHLEFNERPEQRDNRERTFKFLSSAMKTSRDAIASDAGKSKDQDLIAQVATRYFTDLRKFMTAMLRSASRASKQAPPLTAR